MATILDVRNLSRSFPGVRALSDVSFAVETGTVHALAGENGAGKSTLVKILGGLQQPDAGDIVFDGRPVRLRTPHDALRNGIAVIHQELLPFADLTVAENITMGRERTRGLGGWLDKAAMKREARELLARLSFDVDPDRRMGQLSVAGMQTVEIAKALGYGSRLILMDEPTSAISEREVDALLTLISGLKRQGVTIIYISHRMGEIFRMADAVTVLRDGRHVATRHTADLDERTLIGLMAGRELAVATYERTTPGVPILEVIGLTRRGHYRDVSFTLRRGEILGIAGLMGAGRTEAVSAIFGLAPADSGEIRIDGRTVKLASPKDAMRVGIAMVSEDRKRFGIVPGLSVEENITLANLRRYCRGPFVSRRSERAAVNEQIARFGIRTSGPRQRIRNLSGGNQQKAIIARALLNDPSVIILDEPTRGIDVAAKAEVHAIIHSLARAGKAIIMVSSELSELLAVTGRLLVMREGAISAELDPASTTQEEVLEYAMPS